jgi:hypothetical protein
MSQSADKDAVDLARILRAADTLSTEAHHRLMRMVGSAHPCPAEGGCVLSAEEHHRIAYGLLADNRDLRRRLNAFEHGGDAVIPPGLGQSE